MALGHTVVLVAANPSERVGLLEVSSHEASPRPLGVKKTPLIGISLLQPGLWINRFTHHPRGVSARQLEVNISAGQVSWYKRNRMF